MNKKVFSTKPDDEKTIDYCDCGKCRGMSFVVCVKAGCGHKANICTKCFKAGKVIEKCFSLCGGEDGWQDRWDGR